MDNPRLYTLTVASTPSKFVWIQVAKTGTRSVLAVLRQNVKVFELEESYRTPLQPRKYDQHFKFTFVRNPYDRLISGWMDKIVNGGDGGGVKDEALRDRLKDLDFFVDWLTNQDPADLNIHYRPQHLLVPEELDFIGRTETLTKDLALVLSHIGLSKGIPIPHRNKSGSDPALLRDAKPSTLDKVNRLLEPDFKRFGYAMRD